MIINHPNLMCVGVKPPQEWSLDGRSGVTYKVQLSDGTEAIEIKCESGDVYGMFKAFQNYAVALSIVQTSNSGRLGIRASVVGAQPVGK